jgi:hypothetical protein
MNELVGADASQPGRFYGGLDHILIRLVEIEAAACLEVGLLSKAHDNEAGRLRRGGRVG